MSPLFENTHTHNLCDMQQNLFIVFIVLCCKQEPILQYPGAMSFLNEIEHVIAMMIMNDGFTRILFNF